MTTVLLVRHCSVAALGQYLSGRAPGMSLDEAGRAHAVRIGQCFAGQRLDAVYSSPLERARETADALAAHTLTEVQLAEDLIEVDFGEWTGKRFEELNADPAWNRFNTERTKVRIPGGEHIAEVQTRIVGFIERLANRLPRGRVTLVSHGDVIRAALCHYLGLPLDNILRFEISTGSFSVVEVRGTGSVIRCMNVIDFDPRTWLPDSNFAEADG